MLRTFELADEFVEWGGYSYRLSRIIHNFLVSNGYSYHLAESDHRYIYQISISLSEEALVFLKLHGYHIQYDSQT